MQLPQVNYFAVLVSAAVIWILGAVWYSPALFSKRWVVLQGRSEEELKKAAAGSNMGLMLLQAFLCGLVTSWTLAVIINHFVSMTAIRGALVGGLCWFGFAGATSYATNLFSMKPRQLWLIDSGYNLASFILAGIILGIWRP